MEAWRQELYTDELYHHGVVGMKWGVRRYQNPDGTLTNEGKARYRNEEGLQSEKAYRQAGMASLAGAAVDVGLSALGPAGAVAGAVARGATYAAYLGLNVRGIAKGWSSGKASGEANYVEGDSAANKQIRSDIRRDLAKNVGKQLLLTAGESALVGGAFVANMALGGIPGAVVAAGATAASIMLSLTYEPKLSREFVSGVSEHAANRRKELEEIREVRTRNG